MDHPDYTPNPGTDKPSQNLTSTEAYLTEVHGDLHQVIIGMLESGLAFRRVAKQLSDDKVSVSGSWVHGWVRKHHYRRVSRYIRNGGAK